MPLAFVPIDVIFMHADTSHMWYIKPVDFSGYLSLNKEPYLT